MQVHEVSNLFPPMADEEYAALRDSIREHGVRDPVLVHDGKIIDGRHRWRACSELGITPPTVEWDGQGSLAEVAADRNLRRRHLTPGQRAMVAAKLAAMFPKERPKQIRNVTPATLPELSKGSVRDSEADAKAAKIMNVSPRSVRGARVVAERAPELVPDVESGKMTVAAAEKAARGKTPPRPPMVVRPPVEDARGVTVTDPIALKAFGDPDREKFDDLIEELQKLRRAALALTEHELGRELARQRIDSDFRNLIEQIKHAKPFTTCPFRNCEKHKTCKACHGTRWVTKGVWDALDPSIRGEKK